MSSTAPKRSISAVGSCSATANKSRKQNENSSPQVRTNSASTPIQPVITTLHEWSVPESESELHSDSRISRNRKIGRRAVKFPALALKSSKIPEAGLGVFAKDSIKRNQWVTEYGGEVIDSGEAGQRRDKGEDTHIRSAGFKDLCIDSRVRSPWGYDYYVR